MTAFMVHMAPQATANKFLDKEERTSSDTISGEVQRVSSLTMETLRSGVTGPMVQKMTQETVLSNMEISDSRRSSMATMTKSTSETDR